VFGVSLKDRSAILPTGKRPDGAFWFQGGLFITSTYYTSDTGGVPAWVKQFNESKAADRWMGTEWKRLGPKPLYDQLLGPDNRPGEGEGEKQGIAFPHPMTRSRYYLALANSPFGNDLLLEFAKACVVEERLGLHDVPDLLVISFSSNDLIGHTWGPDSHEVLDVTLRSDVIVAELLAFLDNRVGPGRYLLGLTADHGVCPLPEVTQEQGRFAGRVNPDDLRKLLNAHLSKVFAADPRTEWSDAAFPWFYLKTPTLRAHGVLRQRATAEAVKFLAKQPGVARTFTHADLIGPVPSSDELAVKMKRSFHPTRCGDIGVVLKPYWIAYGKTGTTHGAPYDYDTHVPLLVYGPGIRGGKREERVTPQALASIFAKWLDIPRPKDAAFPIPATLE
jgi:predicted AlkP superfamily pyrophosphatase or phosphodiesterase